MSIFRLFNCRLRLFRVSAFLLCIFLAGCQKVAITPTTSLHSISCWRVEISKGHPIEYEFTLQIPNRDGVLNWSASSPENLPFKVVKSKPYSQISWSVDKARVNSLKNFELDLFLESAGPNPIHVSVPTNPAVHLGSLLGLFPFRL